jgi:hypothetical protein
VNDTKPPVFPMKYVFHSNKSNQFSFEASAPSIPGRFQHQIYPIWIIFVDLYWPINWGDPIPSAKKSPLSGPKRSNAPSGRSFGSRGPLIKRKKLPAGRVVGRWEWATRRGHAGIKRFDELN